MRGSYRIVRSLTSGSVRTLHTRVSRPAAMAGLAAVTTVVVGGIGWTALAEKTSAPPPGPKRAGVRVEGLPTYTMEEVARHATPDTRIWVVFREAVYDVTDFIEGHPGGTQKIMQAAGSRIDPFWRLYQQHGQEFVLEILEKYRIGNLHPKDKLPEVNAADPYANDPPRNPSLVVQSAKPFNAEPPGSVIANEWLTPNDLFYVRNHMPVPHVDINKYALEIEVAPGVVHRFTLNDLKEKYAHHSVVATIQCAGNRRNEMTAVKSVRGGSWEAGAISNAEWTGVYLRDVLRDLGVTTVGDKVRHVHFLGLDRDNEKCYGASIPAELALSPEKDVILAFSMNGEPIPADHGFPIRAIVPGVVGARNVKWLAKMIISPDESTSHWQQRDYRGFPSNIDWDNVNWDSMPSIQELPVISAISTADVRGDTIQLKGYAWSGGGRKVIRVDLSTDNGTTWTQAELRPKPSSPHGRDYSWTLWTGEVKLKPEERGAKVEVASRATDDAYNTQPERVAPLWNMRGVLNNAWSRVTVDTSKKQ